MPKIKLKLARSYVLDAKEALLDGDQQAAWKAIEKIAKALEIEANDN